MTERPDGEMIAAMAAGQLEKQGALNVLVLAERERVRVPLVLEEGVLPAAFQLRRGHGGKTAGVAGEAAQGHARIELQRFVDDARVEHWKRRRSS